MLDLGGNATGRSGNDRGALPERLGDDRPEPFTDAILDDDVGHALEGVDLVASHADLVREQEAVRLLVGLTLYLLVDAPSLGVVVGHRARQDELEVREGLPGATPHLDHPVGVLPGSEA